MSPPPSDTGRGSLSLRLQVPLFTATLLLSAFLLFLIQPMVAKMILPILGGSPSVWNTSMVFFQAALLAGYAYAHFATVKLGHRTHATVHLVVFVASLAILPIAIPAAWAPPERADPSLWLIGLLLMIAGLPFFLVASTSPLLQKWFSRTRHPDAPDPYFLYRASNVGSIAALLAYPLVVEPLLPVASQTRLWAAGYVLLVLLVGSCALWTWRSTPREPADAPLAPPDEARSAAPPNIRRRALWVALAFVPSSLMLGVTTHLTTDIAAVPLLWVVPLILYLLSFVLVFGRRPLPWLSAFTIALTMLAPLLIAMHVLSADRVPALLIPLHLTAFFVAATVCHGRLAASRPTTRHLTEFYLWLALGGVLGGSFNALIAPQVFTSPSEYPLALIAACALMPRRQIGRARHERWLTVALPLGLATALLVSWRLAENVAGEDGLLYLALLSLMAILVVFAWRTRPVRFAAGLGAMLILSGLPLGVGTLIHEERTFFGVHTVTRSSEDELTRLLHGTTLHGVQSYDPARRREPLSYYHPSGPLGQVFAELNEAERIRDVGAVGLGAGSFACYARPDQSWTFYEIDPAVVRIAQNPELFTYLRDCLDRYDIVLGDARLSLASAPPGAYDLLILDAFSSDSIPVHLVTREAVELYESKLAAGGVLAIHISNRYLDLAPLFGALARDTDLTALIRADREVPEGPAKSRVDPAHWVVMARSNSDLAPFLEDDRWKPPDRALDRVWTDDFSNLFGILRWR